MITGYKKPIRRLTTIFQLTGKGESRSIDMVADAGANIYPGEGIGFG